MEFFKRFLAEEREEKKIELLQDIAGKHFRFFKQNVDDCLYGRNRLTKEQYKALLPHKDFLRGISHTRYSTYMGYYLAPNYKIVEDIVRVFLNEDEPNTSNGSGASGNMEKSKPRDAGTSEEDSDSEPSSPECSSEDGETEECRTDEEGGEFNADDKEDEEGGEEKNTRQH